MHNFDEHFSGRALDRVLAIMALSYLYLAIVVVSCWMFLDLAVAIPLTLISIMIQRITSEQTVVIHNHILDQHMLSLRNATAMASLIKKIHQGSEETPDQLITQAFSDADSSLEWGLKEMPWDRPKNPIEGIAVDVAVVAFAAAGGLYLRQYSGDILQWMYGLL